MTKNEIVIEILAQQVINWMNRFNECKPVGSIGVTVPDIRDLIEETKSLVKEMKNEN